MDRRSFLKQSLAFGVAAGVDAKASTPAATKQPMNVLFAFSDQHRAVSLPGDPFNQALTPNLDAFRKKSFSMEQCISNYPLCSPYRGILMTGAWPYENGITRNGRQLGNKQKSIGETFAGNGYHTGYVGKWHLSATDNNFTSPGPARQGFQDWHAWCSTDHHYTAYTYDQHTGQRISPAGYSASRMTDEAVTFLKQQTADKPWFLITSWNPPHPPFDPPKQQMDLYKPETLKFRPNVTIQGRQHEATLREFEQGYNGAITAIDLEFGRLLSTLEQTGQADNTIVIYTSDHGEMMGSQGWMGKRLPHEESCRVPFFIHYPGVTPPGGRSQVLFSSIDIYPTLCGLAGIPVPSHCRGRDLSAALRGENVPSQEIVFLMNEANFGDRDGHAPIFRGVRTATHTYAVADSGRWCLYDNVKDPFQKTNLVKDPNQQALMARFDTLIAAWLKSSADPFDINAARTRISTFPVQDTKLPKRFRKNEGEDADD